MKKMFLWLLTLGWAYLIFYLTSIPNFKVSDNTLISFLISNGGHFFFFGIQGLLLYSTLQNKYAAITLTSLYGLIDELHQRNVIGRSADPLDWLLDTLGAILFIAIMKKYLSRKS
jgi:VanZ family protein